VLLHFFRSWTRFPQIVFDYFTGCLSEMNPFKIHTFTILNRKRGIGAITFMTEYVILILFVFNPRRQLEHHQVGAITIASSRILEKMVLI